MRTDYLGFPQMYNSIMLVFIKVFKKVNNKCKLISSQQKRKFKDRKHKTEIFMGNCKLDTLYFCQFEKKKKDCYKLAFKCKFHDMWLRY